MDPNSIDYNEYGYQTMRLFTPRKIVSYVLAFVLGFGIIYTIHSFGV